jgi:hypothetical protein
MVCRRCDGRTSDGKVTKDAPQSTLAAHETIEQGLSRYPVGTVAFYGPDDRRASKVAVGIALAEGAEVTELERWFSDTCDVRDYVGITSPLKHFWTVTVPGAWLSRSGSSAAPTRRESIIRIGRSARTVRSGRRVIGGRANCCIDSRHLPAST